MAPSKQFFVLENCGTNCHFLREQDTTMWKDEEEDYLVVAPRTLPAEVNPLVKAPAEVKARAQNEVLIIYAKLVNLFLIEL